jgi:hypothetical protein
MYGGFREHLAEQLNAVRSQGLWKSERPIESPQNAHVQLGGSQGLLNLCSNNYLGLAAHPEILAAAHKGLDEWGYGMASVRFICGTQKAHQKLENRLSDFLGTDDTILYSSCFDANGGLFETLLGPEDAIISDELNHASIIDGVRLCKAARFRYRNNNLADLEAKLQEAASARFRLIATDGVFSMDGYLADLSGICELADKYNALVMVDDSHAVGFVGPNGRGTPEHFGVSDRVDIVTGTMGKALGGASGGYTSGRQEMITCDNVLDRTCFQIRWPRRLFREPSRLWNSYRNLPSFGSGCGRIPSSCGRSFRSEVSPFSKANIPSFQSCWVTLSWPRSLQIRCLQKASTSSAFRIRWCQWGKLVFAHRCRQFIPPKICSWPQSASRKPAVN